MRSFDIEAMADGEYFVVKLAEPFFDNGQDGLVSMKSVQIWADARCEGNYILLLENILCKNESDALLFTLKYG